jgi:cytoskeletal protein RodZ
MNVSKTLSSAVAAATIVGAVGLAYAQTSSDPATRPADSTMNSNANSTPSANTPSTGSTSSSMPQTTPSTSTTTTQSSDTSVAAPSADLQPKADRN